MLKNTTGVCVCIKTDHGLDVVSQSSALNTCISPFRLMGLAATDAHCLDQGCPVGFSVDGNVLNLC